MNAQLGPTFNQIISVLTFHLFSYGGSSVTVLSLILTAIFAFIFFRFTHRMNRWYIRHVLSKLTLSKRAKREALIIFRYLASFGAALAILKLSGVDAFLYEQLTKLQKELTAVVDLKLFSIGKTPITLWTTVYLLIVSWLLVRLTGQLEELFIRRILSHTKIDRGMSEGMAAGLRYAVIAIGMIVVLQTAGIDLSALTIMAGAVGIAVGLGLQSLMNNLVSGLVILFDRPIKIGDRIDVGGTVGDVVHISLRATTILTNEGIAMIVPNSEFITSKVINCTYNDRKCAYKIPVKVSSGTDPKLVNKLLLEVVDQNSGILKMPSPSVCFDEFGDDGIKFTLTVWTTEYLTQPARLRSDLNFAIAEILPDQGITLPGLPQPATASNTVSKEAPSFAPPAQAAAVSTEAKT